MDSPVVIVMVKAPVPGQVKARLAATIGDEAAASFYRNLSLRIVRSLKDEGIPLTLAYHPPEGKDLVSEVYGPDLPAITQRGSDLGERLKNAFLDVFKEHDGAITIATDVPELGPEVLKRAFELLEGTDVVLGPCPDGGFYLIGFKGSTFREDVFEGIPWSTQDVSVAVMHKLKGLRVSLLPELADIDTPQDILDLVGRLQDG